MCRSKASKLSTATRVASNSGWAHTDPDPWQSLIQVGAQFLAGLAVLAFTVLGSAAWLARILVGWSRKISRLEPALAALATVMADEVGRPAAYRELADAIDAGDPERARNAAQDLLEPATTGLLTAIDNLKDQG